MDNPSECKVCFISFGTETDHRPRTLPCGHTFCSSCITNLLGEDGGRLTCPTCRVQHTASGATHFPINYAMEALIQQMKCLVKLQDVPDTVEGQEEGGEEISDPHKLEVEVLESMMSLHRQCSNINTQLLQRQEQLRKPQAQHGFLLTRLCDLVADNKRALTQVMESQGRYRGLVIEGKSIVGHLEAALEQLQSSGSTQDKKSIVYLARSRTPEIERWIKQYEEASVDDRTLTISTQVLEATQTVLKKLADEGVGDEEAAASGNVFCPSHLSTIMERAQHLLEPSASRPATLTIDDLHNVRPEVLRLLETGQVLGVHQERTGYLRSSRLTLEDGRFHLYHLLDQPLPHYAYTVQVTGYLSALHSSLLVFLDLAWRGKVRGRVYIRLYLDTPLARQFLLLCCGRRGHTYAGTSLLKVCGLHSQGEFIMGGDYTCDDGSGGPPLLSDLHGDYKKTGSAGSVWGRWEVEDHRAAQFAITTRDCRGTIPRVFGCVEEGLDVARTAATVLKKERVAVDMCGVVLNL